MRARAALKANPDASLTAVAKVAGVSRGTVLNARDDMAAEARKAARKEARNSRETSKAAKPTAHGPKRVSDVEEAAAKARVDEHSLEQRSAWRGLGERMTVERLMLALSFATGRDTRKAARVSSPRPFRVLWVVCGLRHRAHSRNTPWSTSLGRAITRDRGFNSRDGGALGAAFAAMQSIAIRGFIAHNRETGVYALTDSGRATLASILEHAGL